ncbi:hypothetical protein ACAG26_12735 [Mycobacterium sp. pUA109]|uniref:hypothetical protein n=1 Tax=Mycobacterium sp. pUA109 TaxID=3238982 RepID=UPI00351BC008
MRIRCARVLRSLAAYATAATFLTACGAGADHGVQPSASSATTTAVPATPSSAGPPATAAPRAVKWVDLDVGECLAEPPPTDPSVVTVSVVDCAAPHRAEVYSRTAVGVNAATADVANERCATGFTSYTGQSLDRSALAVSYLIDSEQDRTGSDPEPSTVICLLQSATGAALTGSARAPR